jgi:hypothetical protein
MPHAEHQIFSPLPGYFENPALIQALQAQIAVLPGRVAVVLDPVPECFAGSSLLTPQGAHAGKFRPDAGTVITSGVPDLHPGDRVLVKPYDGLWMTDRDADWVPRGREIRFYGVSAPWYESVIAVLG